MVCPEFSYLLQVKYEHEKEEWVAAISKAIEDLLRLKRSYRGTACCEAVNYRLHRPPDHMHAQSKH